MEPELARLGKALSSGLRLIHVRDKTLPPAQRCAFASEVVALTGGYDHAVVLINDDQDLARAVGAQGLHLSSSRLWQIDQRPHFEWVAASCRTAADLLRAAALGLDFVVLGPVLPTASHTASTGMGWPAFTRLVERAPLPVYARWAGAGDARSGPEQRRARHCVDAWMAMMN